MGRLKAGVTNRRGLLLLGACAGLTWLCAPPGLKGAAAAEEEGAKSDYHLGPGDKVRVVTFHEPELSGEFLVATSGVISLPLVGDTKVAGLTTSELAREIEGRLTSGGFVNKPSVAVSVLAFRPFYILGEVAAPGQYPYVPGLTIIEAIAMARGFTLRSNKKKAFIKAETSSEEREVRVRPGTEVGPGDTIRIPARLF